jgi:hypothetical protein
MTGGAKYWKISMSKSAGSVSALLLRAIGVDEPFCTLCNNGNDGGGFDTHTTSVKHWQTMCKVVEQSDEVEICVVGGRVRYNHLDGELQVLRDEHAPEAPVNYPHGLSC